MTSSKRKLFETIALVAFFIIGFTFGAIFGNARVNKKKVPQEMAIAITFMDSRIAEMHNDATLTIEAIDGIQDLQTDAQQMGIIAFQTSKSKIYSQTAVGAAEKLIDGNNVPMSEKIFNRQVLSYMMTDMYAAIIKGFITDADAFLAGKNQDDYRAVAFVRDLWVDYLLMDAILKGQTDMVRYWFETGHILTEDKAESYLSGLTREARDIISTSYSLNGAIISLNGRYLHDGSLDDAVSTISKRSDAFLKDSVELPLFDYDAISSCDTLKIDNNYLYSIAVIAPSK